MREIKLNTKDMKKIANFMFDGPRWKVFIVTFSFFFTICFSLFVGLEIISGADAINVFDELWISAILSTALTMLTVTMISTGKESQKFWDKAKEVEQAIDEAGSLEEIKGIYEGEYKNLEKLSMGVPHSYKLTKLLSIMNTKVKYLK